MALSPAHRFGQIIGDALEAGLIPLLEQFAQDHDLYLDKKGARPCRPGKKCSWVDLNGNSHDLDFVLERGGSAEKIGMPVAFIETAWRRYTKHSRNKVQEMQGAVEPLAETYRNSSPFKGAVVAGVFTAGALAQLRSLGFCVLHFPYESVVSEFQKFGIDAGFDEKTSDAAFQRKVNAYNRLSGHKKTRLAVAIFQRHKSGVKGFLQSLSSAMTRQIERIVVLALHGTAHEVTTIQEAIDFVESYDKKGRVGPIERFEIEVRYNNGNVIAGKFKDKPDAIEFLKSYEPVDRKRAKG